MKKAISALFLLTQGDCFVVRVVQSVFVKSHFLTMRNPTFFSPFAVIYCISQAQLQQASQGEESHERFHHHPLTKKVWFNFVSAFVCHSLRNKAGAGIVQAENKCKRECIDLEHFLLFHKSVLTLMMKDLQILPKVNARSLSSFNTYIVLPMGVIDIIHPKKQRLLKIEHCSQKTGVQMVLNWFKLDKQLAVNLTFHFVYFTFGPICSLGRLYLIKTDFEFCGQHSDFSIFPSQSFIGISVVAMHFKVFKVHGTFMAVGKGKVVTHKCNFLNSSNQTPYLIQKHRAKSILFLYHIQVKKYVLLH